MIVMLKLRRDYFATIHSTNTGGLEVLLYFYRFLSLTVSPALLLVFVSMGTQAEKKGGGRKGKKE